MEILVERQTGLSVQSSPYLASFSNRSSIIGIRCLLARFNAGFIGEKRGPTILLDALERND